MSRVLVIVAALLILHLPAALLMADDEKKQDAPEKESLVEALKGGKVAIDLRYRFEAVDQKDFKKNARASTLRTAFSYATRPYMGFNVLLQAESVADIWAAGDHNNNGFGDSGNAMIDRPVIADPPGTEMQQAYMRYQGGDSTVQLGRQEVVLDDARFVGNVGWRQHHQSFRALSFINESLENLRFSYLYVDRVYRITRERLDLNTHLINANYKLGDIGALTGYTYVLRYDAEVSHGLDSNTFGAEFKGQNTLGEPGSIRYELEYASQTDGGNNPEQVSADYLHLMAGGGYGQFGFRIGWERLSGSQRDGQFQTPLATLHPFNGWADKFLSTPTNSLADLYFQADGPAGPLRWLIVYHDFRAATGSDRYGDELDCQITYRSPWDQTSGLVGAFYNAEEFAVDTDKIWLYTGYSF